jgi:lantibiotic leader peptide-processing serine protease
MLKAMAMLWRPVLAARRERHFGRGMGVCMAATCLLLAVATPLAAAETYVVVYQQNAVPADAAKAIAAAGGSVVMTYAPIGVVIAQSGNAAFGANIRVAKGVQGASATSKFGVRNDDRQAQLAADADSDTPVVGLPAPGSDNLSGLQWDMDQISAPAARAINGGSPTIVVGDIDTGIDYTHPDLAPNVDFANSVSCIGGVPNTAPAAWMDDNGHGTHTAGTIAAARNGLGIVGVAPNVKIAGIKAGDANGFFFPEAVVCAFMWVGTHGIAVTNNSYFADPWLFNCKNDPEQRAIWEAERRAIKFAQQNGALVVAAEGNLSDDLAHPTTDVTSPDNTTPVSRSVTNACAVIPVEIAGVVGVTANGNGRFKSFYSSYGVGSVSVIAPGGDSILQRTAAAPNGRVLSTWPAALLNITCAPARRVVDASGAAYCYQQGTSMASPHVAGVAALIASNGIRNPGAIASRLGATSDRIACPANLSIYAPFPSVSNGAPQVCQGTLDYNSFNGNGQVNALRALTD